MNSRNSPAHFQRDQLVEVLGVHEIVATLDADGALDGLPFMPEMVRYCGTRIRVMRRADKTCVGGQGIRQMHASVFLQDLRCDGGFHDGCQRGCLYFWKEAWLRPIAQDAPRNYGAATPDAHATNWASRLPTRQSGRYVCQSTALHAATTPASRWSILPSMREIRQGDLSIWGFFEIVFRIAWTRFLRLPEIGTLTGSQARAARGDLNLQPGEVVDIKNAEELQLALNSQGKNCGLRFTPSMSPYLEGRHVVAFPVTKIILENTGKMVFLSSTVALEGVTCGGPHVRNCPRRELHFWRESWLKRVDGGEHPQATIEARTDSSVNTSE